MKNHLFFSVIFICFKAFSQQVVINEIVSKNENSFDWIELYNNSNDTISLFNYFLSDNTENQLLWSFPNIKLEPKKHLLIYASGKDFMDGDQIHSNFKIKSEGEELYLSNPKGELIDSFPPILLNNNEAFGRFPDGGSNKGILLSATPGQENQNIKRHYSPVLFSHEAGIYTENFPLTLKTTNQNAIIYYSLDGSEPDSGSYLYTDSIPIISKSEFKNAISQISTSTSWLPPKNKVRKGNVVRAVAYLNGLAISPVITKSYFVFNQNNYTVPIISISTDSTHLFSDENGIYVMGNNKNFSRKGREWERSAHFEFFTNGILSHQQNIGIRTQGNKGRTLPQKSLLLYARDSYGKKQFDFPFFSDSKQNTFKRLILRSASSNDWKNTLFKNELTQNICQNLNFSHPKSITVVVFINGEYWGIHHLNERTDEFYLSDYFNINQDEINYLSSDAEVEQGNSNSYLELKSFINQNDLSSETNYQYVCSKIDVSNFIDYNCAQLFLSNTDWPNNNIKYWQAQQNGKWRWIFSDCDECMNYEYYDLLSDFLFLDKYRLDFPQWSTFMMHNLLKNDSFKKQFRSRFDQLLNNEFSSSNVISKIKDMKETYAPLVEEHCLRWNAPSNSAEWEEVVSSLESFAVIRPTIVRQQLQEYFKLPFVLYPNPSNGNISLQLFVEETSLKQFNIKTLSGQTVFNKNKWDQNAIDITFLNPGVYIAEIVLNKHVYYQKIIVN